MRDMVPGSSAWCDRTRVVKVGDLTPQRYPRAVRFFTTLVALALIGCWGTRHDPPPPAASGFLAPAAPGASGAYVAGASTQPLAVEEQAVQSR